MRSWLALLFIFLPFLNYANASEARPRPPRREYPSSFAPRGSAQGANGAKGAEKP